MNRPYRIVAAVSAHGLGHLAQTAPLLNALGGRLGDFRLSVRSALSEAQLRARIRVPFVHEPDDGDVGAVMYSALEVDVDATLEAYRRFHRGWEPRLEAWTQALAEARPDLLIANVSYLALAAARRAGVTSVALCSLNWADIYRHFFARRAEAAAVIGTMRAAYDSAACFLRPAPSMPMRDLRRGRDIGPVAEMGRDRRRELNERLSLAPVERLVIVAYGGTPFAMPLEHWPRLDGVHWVVPDECTPTRDDMVRFTTLNLPFLDLLRSADALIGKPGYGTFVEAACNGTAVLYTPRRDWPEEPALVDWLHEHGRAHAISAERLAHGEFADVLADALSAPPPTPVEPTGIDDACDVVAGLLAHANPSHAPRANSPA